MADIGKLDRYIVYNDHRICEMPTLHDIVETTITSTGLTPYTLYK